MAGCGGKAAGRVRGQAPASAVIATAVGARGRFRLWTQTDPPRPDPH
jgi:hypothetical protein